MAVKRPYISCMATEEFIISDHITYERLTCETKMCEGSFLEIRKSNIVRVLDENTIAQKEVKESGKTLLRNYFLLSRASVILTFMTSRRVNRVRNNV